MKTRSMFFLLVGIALLCFSSTNPIPETHIITLSVDTGLIDEANVDDVSSFGQDLGISNEDFTIFVRNGDIVLWQGVSSSAPDLDQVLIQSINHETGVKVFGRNTLSDDRQNPGVVLGVVTDGAAGDVEKYTIAFKVLNDGVPRGGTYEIDPKIQVNN